MAMHKIELEGDGASVNVFTGAVPVITAGSKVYIQNVSNNDVNFSETNDMSTSLVITERGSATSVLALEAGDVGYVQSNDGRAILTLVSEAV